MNIVMDYETLVMHTIGLKIDIYFHDFTIGHIPI